MRKLIGDEGQTIAEFAVLLPVFVLVAFCVIDIQWAVNRASNVEYIVNEVSRCEALRESSPASPLPCNTSTGGVNAHQYAVQLAQNLRLSIDGDLVINTPECSRENGTCSASIQYGYKPLGVWFPRISIARTGVASYVPGP